MKKIIFFLIILFSVSTIAYAQGELPALSGRYQWDWGWIEFDVSGAGEGPFTCGAVDYDTGESIGNDTNLDPTTAIQFIKVVLSKTKVKAICKFTDESHWYGTSAQLGPIVNCSFVSYECTCEGGGTGQVTAAANHGDEPGGTVTIECTFDRSKCIYCD